MVLKRQALQACILLRFVRVTTSHILYVLKGSRRRNPCDMLIITLTFHKHWVLNKNKIKRFCGCLETTHI